VIGKARLKSVIYGFQIRCAAIISNGLVHRVPKQQTLKLAKKELARVSSYANLSLAETHRLWTETYGRYIRVSKKSFSSLRKANNYQKATKENELDYQEELKLRKNIVYKQMRGELKLIEREKNDVANDYEYRAKHDQLWDQFQTGVFYLCSSHINPAKDHADWEGKIYVNEDWEDRIDEDMHGAVAAYIHNHDVKTVQWVVGEPVYLVTRPNCKHYFIDVSVEEVLKNSVKKLLKKHNMYMQDEKQMSYEYTQYKNYYERLKALTYLHKMFDAEELSEDMSKTRKLMNQWGYRAKENGRE
jgi:hypothetical protein